SASTALIETSGTATWNLVAPDSGPLRDLAMWEKQPCVSGPTAPKTQLNGGSQNSIQGVIDLSCSDVTINGGSGTSTGPFLVGMLICDWVSFTGSAKVAIANDPNLSSAVWGGVLVQ